MHADLLHSLKAQHESLCRRLVLTMGEPITAVDIAVLGKAIEFRQHLSDSAQSLGRAIRALEEMQS